MMPGMPSWVSGAAILAAAAAAVALLAHWLSLRLVLRVPVPGRARGFLQTFIATTTGPSRLAVVVLTLWVALPSADFPVAVSRGIGQVLLVGLVVLVGWSAMRALEVAAALHLRRFRLDVDDNLLARKHVTQVHVLRRAGGILIALVTAAAALMTFPSVRAYGVSLFASAGAASLVVGLAARPLLTNLIAGVQIAVTQPIRLEDAVVVEGEWGWVEEITSTYVIVRLWDQRRMVLPLSYFLERPFQNWTRETTSLIGSVFLYEFWFSFFAFCWFVEDRLPAMPASTGAAIASVRGRRERGPVNPRQVGRKDFHPPHPGGGLQCSRNSPPA
jgi:small-conductance mechanosensitive channel